MFRRFFISLALSLVLPLLVIGEGLSGAARAQDIVFPVSALTIVTGDGVEHEFTVEVASNNQERARGLMFRESLAFDHGMLFDYKRDIQASMWMKNTLIPLDMLFIDRTGIVKNIKERARPHSLDPISAIGYVRGVLELPGGTVARLDIKPGDKVRHPIFGNH
ncbi:MAG: DUF192 domain-containing protein [Alphaproteobacteria bacterium]|nr:DUF192 domain-containing protein [Alphaproteobacteria bacterium]